MLKQSLIAFLKKESSVGILLIIATVLAMMLSNTELGPLYTELMDLPVVVSIGEFAIAKPLLLWINDGLMAVFFFMVGLEIKREVMEGSLADRSKIALPFFAAVGGMIVPALIYTGFNAHSEELMSGWAIPVATDIAFALGVLSLLGSRVPPSLKVFLLALAVIDDLGAILIIAFFYTSSLSFQSLMIALLSLLILFWMNRQGVVNNTAYVLVGVILWVALLKSGVHATLAGVVLGLMIPLRNNRTSFHALESSLHSPVNYVILPLFAFANAGISLEHFTVDHLADGVTMGVLLGLFVGKQVGVFSFSVAAIALKLGRMPEGVGWGHLYGVAILSGIGFTMSLFIGSLAFECADGYCFNLVDERLGVLLGSLLSGIMGYTVLKIVLARRNDEPSERAKE
jgi:Na+:H+ antiporter, NhaA family